jgi:fucose permease
MGAYGLTLFAVGPCLTSIARTFRVALGDTGLLFTAFFSGFIGGVLAAGYIAERVGKRKVTAAGLAILAAGLWLLGASPGPFHLPHLWWALGAMFVMGIGGAGIESTASAMVADVNPGREGFALNLMQAFFGFGAIAGPIVVAAVLARGWGWQTHFLIAGAVAAALFAALLAQKARETPPEPLPLRELGQLLRTPPLLVLCAAMMLYVGCEVGYTGWVSSLIEKGIGARVELAGQAVTAFWVTMTIGRLAVTWLVEVMTPRHLMLIIAIGGALSSGLTGLAPTPGVAIGAAAVVGLFFSGAFGLILTTASERFTRRRAAVFGLIMTSVGVGGMTLPALMGLLAQATSLRWAMLAPAAGLATIALLFAGLGVSARQQEQGG